ncbi:DegV family protein [Clostridiisalibacter paucivorans]|uniref:DegV family protein n=1 Tax=Clostridiisalibacter paucivorans TaxID=408753 RepID=UPI000478CC21|nr:DegV family protein [Clostridiisalibacter paucivorans]
MGIKIITDSGCDLPKEIINEYDIDVLPLIVYLDGNEYLDGDTIESKMLYKGMREGKVFKTAQIPASKFKEVFTKYAEENQECIYIAFSSGLSGTYQTSELIKTEIMEEYPEFKIDIVDSKAASMGFGLIVYHAAKMAKEGKNREEILETIINDVEHMEHVFTVDDLEYLYRGGRVSKTAALVGGLLNVKPILDVQDGKLIPIEKARGKNKVIKRIVEIMEERGNNIGSQVIGISHGDDLDTALKVKDMISEKYDCKEFIINMIGCAIGAHSGPGTLALFFLNE